MLKRLKLPNFWWCGTNVSYTQAYGCRKRGRGFENFSKKCCFLNFEWQKQISPLL